MNLAAGKGEKGSQIIHFSEAPSRPQRLNHVAHQHRSAENPVLLVPLAVDRQRSFAGSDHRRGAQRVLETEAQAVAEIERASARTRTTRGTDRRAHPGRRRRLSPPEFLRTLRRLADEHEFLLFFDEVQSASPPPASGGRSNTSASARRAGASHPGLRRCAGPRVDETDSAFKVSSRITSPGGNPVDIVRCTRIIEVIEEDDLLANATRVGAHLLEGLRRFEAMFPGKVTNARGRGMFLAFDLPDTETRNKTMKVLNDNDVLGLASGTHAIRFRPPVCLTVEQANEGLRRLEKALQSAF